MNSRGTTVGTLAPVRREGRRARTVRSLVAAGAAAALTASLLAVVSVALAPAASAASGDRGTPAQSIAGFATSKPTATKPESKLWFAQGAWWASMASATTGGYSIFRLDRSTRTWVDTGVALDPRGATQGDVLWNGTHLFVASHAVADSSTTTSSAEPARLFRYSWNGSAWTPDAGFPIVITGTSSEALTIAQTDSGRIWATWTLSKKLYVAQTSGSADAASVSFNAGFTPVMSNLSSTASTAATTLNSDDISTVVSANGVTTLVWSNQVTGGTWSARRTDAGSTWNAVLVQSGTLMADDHVNARAIPGDPQGRVVVVLKTSRNDATAPVQTDPLLVAAVYTPATNTWTTSTVSTVAESGTRPMAVVEPATGQVHVFYTGPSTSGVVAYEGTIYEKSASLSTLAFPATGTPVLRDTTNATMNNATSSKQPVTAASGVVVLGGTQTSPRYWFADFGSTLPPAPTASFSPSATSGVAPLAVSFTDTSSGSPTSWSWSFGDGSTSTSRNPSHTFTSAGTFTVTLTATNDGGSTSVSTDVVVTAPVPNAPTASFTASATSGVAPLAVSFTDTSTGSPTSWAWDFGDGSTSTSRNPSHTFTSGGTYTVTLTATNAGGSTSSSAAVEVVEPVVVVPTASFTPSTTSGVAPVTVTFTDTSTGAPTDWAWDFGDGGTSAAQSPSHTYAAAGTYTVTLIASNSAGPSTASATVVVTEPVVVVPTASFTPSTTSGTAPVTVTFTDTSTGAPTDWAWDFGDGGTSTVQSPSHTYAAAGTYTVTLTASNSAGPSTASATVVVTAPVVTPPTASFTASATSGTAPVTVSFTDTSTGSPTSRAWTFGDGGTSTVASPSHTYTAAGTYTVTLTVANAGGSSSATRTIVVSAPPVAGTPIDRVNAGGAAVTGGWLADTSASPSSWVNAKATKLKVASTTSAINVSDPSIPVGTPASLFQTSRYDLSGGKDMIWTMPVPSAGTYTVRLYFAETYWTAAGKRAFDVSINGTKVLTRFDIVAAAGGAKRGIVKAFTVTTSTPIVISFGRVTGLDNPQVNAIEVLS